MIQASYTGVGHAGDNAGGEKAHRRKQPRHIGHVARHQNDGHRLTDGPAHAQHHRRRAQQEVPTDKTLRVAPVEERPEFTPQGKVDDSKTRIFGRLDVEGALKEEQAKAEAPKAGEEKNEAAQETIRLSGEDVQKLKTQAREDHFGVKGKKREEIKPMKKKKGLFGLGKKKDEDDDFLIDANDDDEDDDDLFE